MVALLRYGIFIGITAVSLLSVADATISCPSSYSCATCDTTIGQCSSCYFQDWILSGGVCRYCPVSNSVLWQGICYTCGHLAYFYQVHTMPSSGSETPGFSVMVSVSTETRAEPVLRRLPCRLLYHALK